MKKVERQAFLDLSEAQSTPAELYALWLYTYLSNGGKITHHRDYPYDRAGMLTPTNTESPEKSVRIPTGYGSDALHILNIPQLTPCISTAPTSGDGRPGWEYGHGTLLTLEVDAAGSLRATTNDPDVVESWPEINELLRKMSEPTWRGELESGLRATIQKVESRKAIEQAPGTDIALR